MIDNFNDLVDQRTLARHCLGLEPSPFVLRAIEIKEKSKCLFHIVIALNFPFFFFFFNKCFSFTELTTKFNQEMYAKMRAKKNDPLSNLRKRVVRVLEKGLLSLLLASSLKQRGPLLLPPRWKRLLHARRSSMWRTKAKRRPTHARQASGKT